MDKPADEKFSVKLIEHTQNWFGYVFEKHFELWCERIFENGVNKLEEVKTREKYTALHKTVENTQKKAWNEQPKCVSSYKLVFKFLTNCQL